MFKGFRDFILRGNVLDLAVAVILGMAFNAVVTSLVKDVLTQLIAAVAGKPDFSSVVLKVNGTPIMIGNFLNATRIKKPAPEAPPSTKPCPECLSEIPLAARRCCHCTQPVA
jgi:large conductance mechanosensitive channel